MNFWRMHNSLMAATEDVGRRMLEVIDLEKSKWSNENNLGSNDDWWMKQSGYWHKRYGYIVFEFQRSKEVYRSFVAYIRQFEHSDPGGWLLHDFLGE